MRAKADSLLDPCGIAINKHPHNRLGKGGHSAVQNRGFILNLPFPTDNQSVTTSGKGGGGRALKRGEQKAY